MSNRLFSRRTSGHCKKPERPGNQSAPSSARAIHSSWRDGGTRTRLFPSPGPRRPLFAAAVRGNRVTPADAGDGRAAAHLREEKDWRGASVTEGLLCIGGRRCAQFGSRLTRTRGVGGGTIQEKRARIRQHGRQAEECVALPSHVGERSSLSPSPALRSLRTSPLPGSVYAESSAPQRSSPLRSRARRRPHPPGAVPPSL